MQQFIPDKCYSLTLMFIVGILPFSVFVSISLLLFTHTHTLTQFHYYSAIKGFIILGF